MKNHKRHTWLSGFLSIACLVFVCLAAHAQRPDEITSAPDVWRFTKYGNHQPNLYTGGNSVSIPIYTYSDQDFTIPISVDYASDGFLPNQQTGILGMGWFLNAGGCITREVRDVPDEWTNSDVFPAHGYLHYFNGGTTPNWSNVIDANHNSGRDLLTYVLTVGSRRIETRSDTYHFNFPGHSGTFCLGPNKQVYIYNTTHPHGEYTIDMTYASTGTIIISTGDGYRYTFGGSSRAHRDLDHYSLFGVENHPSFLEKQYNLTWMLTKIKAPNGRTVDFKYPDQSIIYEVSRPTAYGTDSFSVSDLNLGSQHFSYANMRIGANESEIVSGGLYGTRLEEIVVSGQSSNADLLSVKFNYRDDKPQEKRRKNNVLTIQPLVLKNIGSLANIRVTTAGGSKVLKNCSFTYYTNQTVNSNPVTFLRKLQIEGEEPYVFQYYDEDEIYPYHGTSGLDHWGYYTKNNTYDGLVLIPRLEYDSRLNEKITTATREPNFLGSRMGMLRTITYPTKGYSRFEYEGNEYTRKIVRNYDSQCNPRLMPAGTGGYSYPNLSSYPAGGVRVKKIVDYSSQEDSTYRVFRYSPGILLHYPTYFSAVRISYKTGNATFYSDVRQRSGTDLIGLSLDKSHISYSWVREELADGSYTENRFSDYDTTPDDYAPGLIRTINPLPTLIPTVLSPQYAQNLYRKTISYHSQRGKLIERSAFDNMGNRLQKTTYHYDYYTSKKYAECLEMMPAHVYVHKTLVTDLPLVRQTEVMYYNGGTDSIRTVSRFSYNRHGQLTETVTEHPHVTESLSTLYVTDFVDSDPNSNGVLQRMVSYGFRSYPLRMKKTVDSKLTMGIYNRYSLQTVGTRTFPTLYQVYQTELLYPVTCTAFDFDQYLVAQSTYSHDSYGYVWAIENRDETFSYFVYGYNGLYPVAVIDNANWDEVGRILFNSKASPPHLPESLNRSQSDLLRAIPNISITTYTYEPFIGVTSIEDPSGQRINYRYDNYGRLESVLDKKNNFMQVYEYNFKKD